MNVLKKSALTTACAAVLTTGVANAAPAQYHCYDFDGLASDANYAVDDVIETRHATITIKEYFINGDPATAATRGAQVASSQVAGGAPPEMLFKLVSVKVVPKKPVSRVRTRLAQSISKDGGFSHANIQVNGEKHESPGGFSAMDGRSIGRSATGRAQIRADIATPTTGNWHAGTFELKATQGLIESFKLGGHTWRIDDLCLAL